MDKCPKCGGTSGWYTNGRVFQYYKINGEPNGYDFGDEGKMATCLDCGKQIKLAKILQDRPKYALGDKVYVIIKNAESTSEVVEGVIIHLSDAWVGVVRSMSDYEAGNILRFRRALLDVIIFKDRKLADGALFRRLSEMCGGRGE